MKLNQIELHIDELVLDGFDVRDQPALAHSLEVELQRLFIERGVPAFLSRGGDLPAVDGGVLNTVNSSAEKMGIQVAENIYRGLSNTNI